MTSLLQPSKAFDIFKQALKQKSIETEKTYEACFWAFLNYRNQTSPDELLKGMQQEKEDAIKAFIADKSYSMANKTVWALTMFYSANRINIDWNHVRLFMPKPRDNPDAPTEDAYRPYKHEEIALLWKIADSRQLAATGIMCAGVRSGGLAPIKTEDLIWLENYKLYAIRVYSFSKSSAYWTFATPQVSNFINDYIKETKKHKSEYLFIDKRNAGWHISTDTLEKDTYRLLINAGLRTLGEKSETQADHGFRKFFRTQLEIARIDDQAAERLMGRITHKLKQIYSMPEPEKLLKATNYPLAIPNLTINF